MYRMNFDEYRMNFAELDELRKGPCCDCGHVGEPFDEDTEPDMCDCHWQIPSWEEIDATLHIPAAGASCRHCALTN
jgi:hypothetical protein